MNAATLTGRIRHTIAGIAAANPDNDTVLALVGAVRAATFWHVPDAHGNCCECGDVDGAVYVTYPCSTVTGVAEALGVKR